MSLISALTTLWFADNVKRGTAVFNNVISVNVVFLTPFANVPKIVVTMTTVLAGRAIAVTAKSVNGFTITADKAITTGVDWIAISP